MASLVIVLDALRKCTVKVTPSATLQSALEEACTKLKLSASDYTLSVNSKDLDLSLPFRLSGLTQNQKVQLTRRKTSANVSIALQLENGDRLQQSFLANITLSDMLKFWETKIPSTQNFAIQYMNREYPSSSFSTTTLTSLGLSSGSGLLRLLNKSSQAPTESPAPVPTPSPMETTQADTQVESPEEPQVEEIEEPVVNIPVHRNIQVVVPTAVTSNEEMDEDFYEVTAEDLAYLVTMEKKQREAKDLLLTKKLREQFKNTKRYKQSDIRIKFPDRVQIQGTFVGSATTEELVAWVQDQLEVTEKFYLYTAPPLKKLENGVSLHDQQLVPAALVHLSFENKELNNKPTMELLKKQSIEAANENVKESKKEEEEEKSKESSSVGKEEEIVEEKKVPGKSSGSAPVPKWLKMGNKR